MVLASMANKERKMMLQRTIPREIELEQQGYHMRNSNYGFRNEKQKFPE
jgi:hypothetical protein